MISFRSKILTLASFISDMALTVLAFFLAYTLRITLLQPYFEVQISGFHDYYWIVFIICPLWAIIFLATGRYQSFHIRSLWHEIIVLGLDLLMGGAIVISMIFMVKNLYPRSLILIFLAIDFVFLGLRVLSVPTLGKYFSNMISQMRILIVGTPHNVEAFLNAMDRNNAYGLDYVGILCLDESDSCVLDSIPDSLSVGICSTASSDPGKKGELVPMVGHVSDIEKVLDTMQVDGVVFSVGACRVAEVTKAMQKCEETGAKIYLDLEIPEISFSRGQAETVGGKPLLSFCTADHNPWALSAKRAFDLVGGAALFAAFLPAFIIVPILVKLSSKGPALFVQRRSGLSGREFDLIKFRTMVQDAGDKKQEIMDMNEMEGPVFKIKDDPRVTGMGKVLRSLSLDEIPQLFNVLKGDMSLVGPRPLPIEETQSLPERWQRRRLSMKPGITCLWQVNGRNKINFEDWMKLDLEYIDNWSLNLDLRILFRTIPAVLFTKGAS